jgi:hypothetical protein
MARSKLIKIIFMGMCLSIFLSAAVFADTGGGQSGAFQGRQAGEESALLQKQREIDRYLFGEHSKEIADKGFKVTHTGPAGSVVEIGITPYSEENAEYLYNIFGRDSVKVVEGTQAVLLTVDTGSPDSPVSSQAPDVPANISNQGNPAAAPDVEADAAHDAVLYGDDSTAETNAASRSRSFAFTDIVSIIVAFAILAVVAVFARKRKMDTRK